MIWVSILLETELREFLKNNKPLPGMNYVALCSKILNKLETEAYLENEIRDLFKRSDSDTIISGYVVGKIHKFEHQINPTISTIDLIDPYRFNCLICLEDIAAVYGTNICYITENGTQNGLVYSYNTGSPTNEYLNFLRDL